SPTQIARSAKDQWNETSERSVSTVSNLYEIFELPNGEIVLQRLEGDAQPLLRIRFSDQAKAYMDDASLMVAKVMVEAGIKAINELGQDRKSTRLNSS